MGYGDFLNGEGRLAGRGGLTLENAHLQYPLFNEIVENHIHHTGEINYFTAGIFAALSEDNVLARNSIHDVPQHAINLGSSGLSRNIVEGNDIRRACQKADDTGAINCWADAQEAQRPAPGTRHPL